MMEFVPLFSHGSLRLHFLFPPPVVVYVYYSSRVAPIFFFRRDDNPKEIRRYLKAS